MDNARSTEPRISVVAGDFPFVCYPRITTALPCPTASSSDRYRGGRGRERRRKGNSLWYGFDVGKRQATQQWVQGWMVDAARPMVAKTILLGYPSPLPLCGKGHTQHRTGILNICNALLSITCPLHWHLHSDTFCCLIWTWHTAEGVTSFCLDVSLQLFFSCAFALVICMAGNGGRTAETVLMVPIGAVSYEVTATGTVGPESLRIRAGNTRLQQIQPPVMQSQHSHLRCAR